MKAMSLALLLIMICSSVIGQDNSALRQLDFAEVKEKKANGTFHYTYATFTNMDGVPLSDYERQELNHGKMAMKYFEDKEGEIREVRIRPYTLDDKFEKAILYSASLYDTMQVSSVDCDSLAAYIKLKKEQDEAMSKYVKSLQDSSLTRREIWDRSNAFAEKHFTTEGPIFNMLKTCEWNEDNMKIVVEIMDNNYNGRLAAYYFFKIRALYEEGKFEPKVWARIQDRILVDHGFDQIYGTVIRNGRLAKIESPYNVNSRRLEMNLGPIEQTLEEQGLDFDIEVHRMTRFE